MAEKENKAHRLICKYRYNLTFEQQRFLEKDERNSNLNSDGNLVRLTRNCFKNPNLDEHSDELKNVKNFLIKVVKRGNECVNLSDEHIEYIKKNGTTMRPADIGRVLFPDATSHLSKEFATIRELAEALDVKFIETEKKRLDDWVGDYEPPRQEPTIMRLINEVDSMASYSTISVKNDPVKRDCLDALKNYLQSPRFIFMASSIKRLSLRKFFEKEFIRCCYNKPDLNTEDLNGYISLCSFYVEEMLIKEAVAAINDRLQENVSDDDEGRKMTMTMAEALKAKIGEAKDIRTQIQNHQKMLNTSRAKRLENMTEANKSLNRFVELVQHEKGRQVLIRMAEAKHEELKEEAKKITNHDELIAEIWGTSLEELLSL